MPDTPPDLTPVSASGPRRKGWSLGLILSLCLNVFLISAIVVGVRHQQRFGLARDVLMAPEAAKAAGGWQKLSPETRGRVRSQLRGVLVELRAEIIAVRQARRELRDMLARPDLQPAQLDAGFAKVQQADAALRAALYRRVTPIIIDLPVADRMVLLRGLEARLRGRFPAALERKRGDLEEPAP